MAKPALETGGGLIATGQIGTGWGSDRPDW